MEILYGPIIILWGCTTGLSYLSCLLICFKTPKLQNENGFNWLRFGGRVLGSVQGYKVLKCLWNNSGFAISRPERPVRVCKPPDSCQLMITTKQFCGQITRRGKKKTAKMFGNQKNYIGRSLKDFLTLSSWFQVIYWKTRSDCGRHFWLA